MKLKECDPVSYRGKKPPVTPAIGVNDIGCFSFNKSAMALLGVVGGEQVKIFKDEEDAENWYIEVVDSGGYQVQKRTSTRLNPRFNAANVAKEIFETVGFEGRSGSIIIAGQPTILGKRKLYGLIISRLKTI